VNKKTKNKTNEKPQIPFLRKGFSTDNSEMNSILLMMEKLLHWAAIIESSDDAIISKSVEGYITSWNRGAQRLYGYTPEEIIGQPVSVLMPPNKKDDFPFIMNQLHEGKRVEHYETQRMTKDNKILHVSITVSPIRDSQGNIIGASKIARDITDRIEDEKRRDEFVSTASHELKTPITSQKVFGELLEQIIDRNDYKELKPYIQKINQQTDKMTKLV
jgi:two-component system, OmpR family, sensor histidine kinase VicK